MRAKVDGVRIFAAKVMLLLFLFFGALLFVSRCTATHTNYRGYLDLWNEASELIERDQGAILINSSRLPLTIAKLQQYNKAKSEYFF